MRSHQLHSAHHPTWSFKPWVPVSLSSPLPQGVPLIPDSSPRKRMSWVDEMTPDSDSYTCMNVFPRSFFDNAVSVVRRRHLRRIKLVGKPWRDI